MSTDTIIIGDSDGLIALVSKDDYHHQVAHDIVLKIYETGSTLIFPVAILAETITIFTRKYNNPQAANDLVRQVIEGPLLMVDTTGLIMKQAAEFFNPLKSKKDTFFDAIVAATAKVYKAGYIYSFDGWYEKQGFKLAKGLLDKST